MPMLLIHRITHNFRFEFLVPFYYYIVISFFTFWLIVESICVIIHYSPYFNQ